MGSFLTVILNFIGFVIRRYIFRIKIKFREWYLYDANNIIVGVIFLVLALVISAMIYGYL